MNDTPREANPSPIHMSADRESAGRENLLKSCAGFLMVLECQEMKGCGIADSNAVAYGAVESFLP